MKALQKARNILQGLLMLVCLSGAVGIVLPPGASAQSNPVVVENQQPGTSQWQIGDFFSRPVATTQIKGYASAHSVNKGGSINFYVSVNTAQTYTIDIYRLGWYQG